MHKAYYFDNLPVDQSDPSQNSMRAGKRVLSSPEQEETTLKRSREQGTIPFSSIEDTEEMQKTSLQSNEASNEPGSISSPGDITMDTQANSNSRPGTSSDSPQVNTQTITVDVHHLSCLTEYTESVNNENSVTHEPSK